MSGALMATATDSEIKRAAWTKEKAAVLCRLAIFPSQTRHQGLPLFRGSFIRNHSPCKRADSDYTTAEEGEHSRRKDAT